MTLASLQHLVGEVRALAADCQVIVLGSASLLASFPELGDSPGPLTVTYDADLCPQPFDLSRQLVGQRLDLIPKADRFILTSAQSLQRAFDTES